MAKYCLSPEAIWDMNATEYRRQLDWLIAEGDSARAYQLVRHIMASCPRRLRPIPLTAGDTVKFTCPVSADEADLRFTVLETYDGRAHIRCENLPGWTSALRPIQTVSVDELETA